MLNGGMGGKEGKVKLTTNFPSSRAAYVAISTSNFILALVSYLHQPASRTHARACFAVVVVCVLMSVMLICFKVHLC